MIGLIYIFCIYTPPVYWFISWLLIIISKFLLYELSDSRCETFMLGHEFGLFMIEMIHWIDDNKQPSRHLTRDIQVCFVYFYKAFLVKFIMASFFIYMFYLQLYLQSCKSPLPYLCFSPTHKDTHKNRINIFGLEFLLNYAMKPRQILIADILYHKEYSIQFLCNS